MSRFCAILERTWLKELAHFNRIQIFLKHYNMSQFWRRIGLCLQLFKRRWFFKRIIRKLHQEICRRWKFTIKSWQTRTRVDLLIGLYTRSKIKVMLLRSQNLLKFNWMITSYAKKFPLAFHKLTPIILICFSTCIVRNILHLYATVYMTAEKLSKFQAIRTALTSVFKQ